jgi:hypothetical protein
MPCSQCPDNSNTYAFNWPNAVQGAISATKCHCDPGYFSADGFAPCTPCGEGADTVIGVWETWAQNYRYRISAGAPGQTVCKCQQGYFSSDGLGPCSKCPDGTMNTNSRTSCDICAAGYFSVDGNGQAPCQICPVGSSNADLASNSCPICDIGFYSPSGLLFHFLKMIFDIIAYRVSCFQFIYIFVI